MFLPYRTRPTMKRCRMCAFQSSSSPPSTSKDEAVQPISEGLEGCARTLRPESCSKSMGSWKNQPYKYDPNLSLNHRERFLPAWRFHSKLIAMRCNGTFSKQHRLSREIALRPHVSSRRHAQCAAEASDQ